MADIGFELKRNRLAMTRVLFLCAVMFVLTGCFTLPSQYMEAEKKTVNDGYSRSNYHKMVAVSPLSINTFLPDPNLGAVFQNAFVEALKDESPDTRFVMADAARYPMITSAVNNGQLVSFGREYGFNAVVSTAILDIQTRAEEEGIWLFKGTQHYLQIRIQAEAMDPGTGARLSSEIMAREIEIDDQNVQMIKARQPDLIPDLAEEVLDMAEDLGEMVAEKLDDHQWRGLVVSSDDSGVLIAPGANAGLASGDRFEIFDGSRTIKSADGTNYIVPGYKKGEIAVTSVSPHNARATLSSGEMPEAGDFVLPIE